MTETLTVSRLNEQIKSLLESTFIQVAVEGELSRVTYHTSGHIYFTIKDAKSSLSCVMFRSNAQRLRFRLEEGMHVVLRGAVTVYVPRGNYQMMVQHAEPYGEGALAMAFEQLKKRLAAEGLFDAARKKPMPSVVRTVAVVTSKTGAAIQDMIRVAAKRWPLVKITLVDTLVQGADAAEEIARHIAYADTLGADVMIVGRGGGSREDLWAFNEEVVARAVAACKTPVVSAVGHEVDTLISDFVADMRAPTPSAAMEQILPDRYEVLMGLDETMEGLTRRMGQIIAQKEDFWRHVSAQMESHAISRKLALQLTEVRRLQKELDTRMVRLLQRKGQEMAPTDEGLTMQMRYRLAQKEQQLLSLQRELTSLDPARKLRPGFVQLVKNGRPTGLEGVEAGDEVLLEEAERVAKAKILSVEEAGSECSPPDEDPTAQSVNN